MTEQEKAAAYDTNNKDAVRLATALRWISFLQGEIVCMKNRMSKSTKINDGGPAFPYGAGGAAGMSLRDWFAGQALVGLLANANRMIDSQEEAPEECYRIADAMIAERGNRDAETQQDLP